MRRLDKKYIVKESVFWLPNRLVSLLRRRNKWFCHYNTYNVLSTKCVVYKSKAMRGAWESEKHSCENEKNPSTTHHISKADNIKLVKGAMDDASDLESWAIFTEILVIFLKGRKKHSKIMQIKN